MKPQVNRYKPDSEPGVVSPDTSRQNEGIFPPETTQGAALVGDSELDKEIELDNGNYGKFDVR